MKIASIYPNPANNGYVTIQLSDNYSSEINGSIVKVGSGKLVKQFKINGSMNQMALDNLATGVSVIQLSAEKFVENHKLIIER